MAGDYKLNPENFLDFTFETIDIMDGAGILRPGPPGGYDVPEGNNLLEKITNIMADYVGQRRASRT